MKTNPLHMVAVAAALIAGSAMGLAEEAAKAQAEAAKAQKSKAPALAAEKDAIASTTNSTPASAVGLAPAGSALLDLSNRESAGTVASTERQTGPEPAIKVPAIRSLDERGGALRYLVKEPKPVNLLQLINPFAPMSLGEGGRLVNVWSPLDGAAPVPRAFRDERTHEPMGVLLGWP